MFIPSAEIRTFTTTVRAADVDAALAVFAAATPAVRVTGGTATLTFTRDDVARLTYAAAIDDTGTARVNGRSAALGPWF